jgi:hypothetical protein
MDVSEAGRRSCQKVSSLSPNFVNKQDLSSRSRVLCGGGRGERGELRHADRARDSTVSGRPTNLEEIPAHLGAHPADCHHVVSRGAAPKPSVKVQ